MPRQNFGMRERPNHFAAPSWAEMTAPEETAYEEIYTKEQLLALANSDSPA
ncbi:MAG: hypothetical protein ACLUVV_04710 [Christensenellales bacterium]